MALTATVARSVTTTLIALALLVLPPTQALADDPQKAPEPSTSPYPLTLTDLAGREVTLTTAPERIVLQDSNDLLALSVLEPASPAARVVGFQNTLEGSDPGLWAVLADRWPQVDDVPEITFNSSGQIDTEGIINLAPDLVIARLPARTAIEEGQLGRMLDSLDIPLIYVDTEYSPLANVPRSIDVLGQALNRQAPAEAFSHEYRERLAAIRERVAGLSSKRVFVEIRAGESGDECCKTHGTAAWGQMIEALGATNIANDYLGGLPSGTIALEALISNPPDIYLMTGTQRMHQGHQSIPLGYLASDQAIDQKMATLMNRAGFGALAGQRQCVQALHHQFYNNIFNVVALEYLAQVLWPQDVSGLDPAASYRDMLGRYTQLPTNVPFIFSAEHCLPGAVRS